MKVRRAIYPVDLKRFNLFLSCGSFPDKSVFLKPKVSSDIHTRHMCGHEGNLPKRDTPHDKGVQVHVSEFTVTQIEFYKVTASLHLMYRLTGHQCEAIVC